MKRSLSKYCGECLKDLEPAEVVFFAQIENRSFCVECRLKLKLKIRDWEPRQIPLKGDEEE